VNKNKTKPQIDEKKRLKTVIYDDKCPDTPYFDELVESLKSNGITVSREDIREAGKRRDDCLCICSSRESAEDAKKTDAAFVCFGVRDSKAQCEIEGFDEVDADFMIKMYQRKHGIPWEICRTERLLIREFALSDDLVIFDEKKDEPDYNELYINNIYGFFGYGIWALINLETGKLIGKAGIMNSERLEGIELGYEILEEYRNLGYATEACRAIVNKAGGYYGIGRLYAFTMKDNEASKRVLHKLGFVSQGLYDENVEKYMANIVDNGQSRV